jgi:Gpi18-like mannosyltransferase
MTYEDAVRVAQLKTRAGRFERIRRDKGVGKGEIVVTDYLKPDLDEIYGVLPYRLVAPFARWDARWYLDIAHSGYIQFPPGRAAFFPLYPLLLAIGGAVFGSPLICGIVISFVCAFFAFAFLHRLTKIELGADAARHTVWILAFSPMAYYLSAIYSESLFLMLSVGAVLAARTGRWTWAATAGVLAAATRNAGILLILPLMLLWWQRRDPPIDPVWVARFPETLDDFRPPERCPPEER